MPDILTELDNKDTCIHGVSLLVPCIECQNKFDEDKRKTREIVENLRAAMSFKMECA